MKIGILTRRYGYNMGSTLQALAMVEMLRSLGHDVEVIDYDETSGHPKWKLRPAIEHLMYKLKIPRSGMRRDYLEHRMGQEKKFEEFEGTYLPLTSGTYKNAESLAKISKNYDKIVAGSDQIWNPMLYDPIFFGNFISTDQLYKFLPYAPSIGVNSSALINPDQKTLLRRLPTLSCREIEGASVLTEITGREIPVVLDPTLMINPEFWTNITNSHKVSELSDNYLLTYFLGNVSEETQKEIEQLARTRNLRVINIAMFNKPNHIKPNSHLKELGPGEFLSVIKDASYIATDSFHATVFSWIFNRDFRVFLRFNHNDPKNQNSRIHTLLDILGCKNKIYGFKSTTSENSQIENLRKSSFQYLVENI